MTSSEHRLLRHLGWVLLAKLLVLVGLWQAFVADQRVRVDPAATAAHLVAPADAASAPGPGQGAHP